MLDGATDGLRVARLAPRRGARAQELLMRAEVVDRKLVKEARRVGRAGRRDLLVRWQCLEPVERTRDKDAKRLE